jgi:hypothetical protein
MRVYAHAWQRSTCPPSAAVRQLVKRQVIGTPDRHGRGAPSPALGQACRGSEQEGPGRVAQCPQERRSGARGRCLFAHRAHRRKPGWHSGAVLEAPALVAGFDDFAMMRETVEERGCHLGVAKHTGPIAKGQVGRDMTEVRSSSRLIRVEEQLERFKSAPSAQRFLPPSTIIQYSTTRASRATLRKPGALR